jgi:hypothetical protein
MVTIPVLLARIAYRASRGELTAQPERKVLHEHAV